MSGKGNDPVEREARVREDLAALGSISEPEAERLRRVHRESRRTWRALPREARNHIERA